MKKTGQILSDETCKQRFTVYKFSKIFGWMLAKSTKEPEVSKNLLTIWNSLVYSKLSHGWVNQRSSTYEIPFRALKSGSVFPLPLSDSLLSSFHLSSSFEDLVALSGWLVCARIDVILVTEGRERERERVKCISPYWHVTVCVPKRKPPIWAHTLFSFWLIDLQCLPFWPLLSLVSWLSWAEPSSISFIVCLIQLQEPSLSLYEYVYLVYMNHGGKQISLPKSKVE